ncbi:MAG TPA: hypothetical protein VLD58_17105 [Gemmatimonadales bacterium]|nr:hypothetical protein [Gemmatimonadales bacterium]
MRAHALRARPLVHVGLGAGLASGCSSWHTVPVAPQQLVAETRPGAVRVRQPGGTRLVIARPQIVGDSLTGSSGRGPVGVGSSDVTENAVRRTSALKTGGLVLGILALPFALIGGACALGAGCHFGAGAWGRP